MQDSHLHGVGEELSDGVRVAGDGVDGCERAHVVLERPRDRGVTSGVAGDVDRGRVVGVDLECSCVATLGGQQPGEVGVDLADLAVRAWRIDTIAAGRARSATDKVVALVRGENEQGVALVDAVVGEAREELAERGVIRLQGGDVSSLAGAVGRAGRVVVMRIRDVGVGDGDAVLLHGCNVGKRNLRRHSIEAGEADAMLGILDYVSVEIGHRTAGADLRCHVLVSEQTRVARVPARLVRQVVRLAAVGGRAE